MAYETQYRIQFDTFFHNEVIILFQKKDSTPPVSVQEYNATSVKRTRSGNKEGIFASIIGTELVMTFNMEETDIDYWNEFVDAEHDTWKVIGTIDGKFFFHGFVIPDEGAVPFQDLPYQATIRATDMLGLLKHEPLVDFAGNNLEGEYTIIEILAYALARTGLELDIQVYDNLYHKTMQTRLTDFKWDMVGQTKLEYRTFLSDPVTFVSCYEAIRIICERGFRMFYQEGRWVFKRLGMYQYNPSQKFYTVYAHDLSTAEGFEDPTTHTLVGKDDVIFAINEDQIKTVKFANRSVKTVFNYVPWPEIPKNNQFERGTLILPYSGVGFTSHTIDDWTFGGFTGGADTSGLPNLKATTKIAYRRSSFNVFGIEVDRHIILEQTPTDTNSVLLSEGVPVIAGDKIRISFDRKLSYGGFGANQVAMIWVQAPSGQRRFIASQPTSDMRPFYWVSNTATRIVRNYSSNESFDQFTSFTIEPPEIPITGKLYIGLLTTGVTGSEAMFKSFEFDYYAYVAGGYIQVTADYWLRSQNKNYPDVADNEIFISDNDHKAFKGVLLKSDGTTFTPEWYRLGLTENRHFKEQINIAEYNLLYRRYWNVEGSFKGLMQNTEDAPTLNFFPLSLAQLYKLNDIEPEERFFMLDGPVDEDFINATFTAQFTEVAMVPDGATGTPESLNSFMLRVITAINMEPSDATGWNQFGGAPAAGTVAYPPSAHTQPNVPNTIAVAINNANTMTAVASANGAGNAPSINKIFDASLGPYRMIQFTFGTDLAVGNQFTFTAYGHSLVVEVQSSGLMSADGSQLGDTATFNYKFK